MRDLPLFASDFLPPLGERIVPFILIPLDFQPHKSDECDAFIKEERRLKGAENMGIVKTTAYPSRYADEEWVDAEVQIEEPSVGKLQLRVDLMKTDCRYFISGAQHQKQLAALLGAAMGAKPVYERKSKYYTVGDWYVIASCDGSVSVGSGLFDIDEAEKNLRVLDALHDAGYVPDETVDIFFTPDVYDLKLVLNLCNIMEARNKLIVQALGLDEEIQIVVDESLAFGIPLSAFSFEKIEACVYLLRQVSLMAANTGKARMKPCDGSNPKYQMRTWLLRLGFIGDQYARPRQTLLNGLDGDGAFFSDDGKEKAAMKRKSKRMAG